MAGVQSRNARASHILEVALAPDGRSRPGIWQPS